MKTRRFILIVYMGLALAACGRKTDHAQVSNTKYTCSMHPQVVQDHPGKCPICGMDLVPMNDSDRKDGSIMLSESQIKLGNISTTLTQYQDFSSTIILNGRLMVNEEQTEVISSRAKGRIEKLYFKESGHRIEQGQPLYEIYSEQLLTMQQEYLLALNQYEQFGQQRYAAFLRASEKKLLLSGVTKNQIRQLAMTKTTDSKITMISPFPGVITRIDAVEGKYVEEGSPLYRIEKLDLLWVEAELYANEGDLAKTGDTVKVMVSGFESSPADGRVTFVSPEYRNGSQIITLRATISNPKHLFLPGMQANLMLIRAKKKVIALPVDAVIRDAGGNHVWILTEEGAYKPRMVVTGLEDSYKVEIISGLGEKENVVITGAYSLYGELVLKKGGNPMAGHNH